MDILFEDDYIVVANKKAKQFVHPMPGERDSKDCLLFDVRDYAHKHVFAINRLDRPVSGIVFFAKEAATVADFQKIWHDSTTKKKYLCLHRGHLKEAGCFDSHLSKRGTFKSADTEIKQEALTLYHPIEYFPELFCTYTEVEIKTGRYHQIRRHFRKAVMPIIGDRKHGKGAVNKQFEELFSLQQIFLHCHSTEMIHPLTQEKLNINCQLPNNLQEVLKQIKEP